MNISINTLNELTNSTLEKYSVEVLNYINNFPNPIKNNILQKIANDPMILINNISSPMIMIPYENCIPSFLLSSLEGKFRYTTTYNANIGIHYAELIEFINKLKYDINNDIVSSYIDNIIYAPFYDKESIITVENYITDIFNKFPFNTNLIQIISAVMNYKYEGYNLIHNKFIDVKVHRLLMKINPSSSLLSMLNLLMSTQLNTSSDTVDFENLAKMFVIYLKTLGVNINQNIAMIKKYIKYDNEEAFIQAYDSLTNIIKDLNYDLLSVMDINDESIKNSILFSIKNEENINSHMNTKTDITGRIVLQSKKDVKDINDIAKPLIKIIDNPIEEMKPFTDDKYWNIDNIIWKMNESDIGMLKDKGYNILIAYDNMNNKMYTLCSKSYNDYFVLFRNSKINSTFFAAQLQWNDNLPRTFLKIRTDQSFEYKLDTEFKID